jgi:hypothetical protein
MIERASKIRSSLDAVVMEEVIEWQVYWNNLTWNSTRPAPTRRGTRPKITEMMLLEDDWVVISQYTELLKPFKIATKRLEGRISNGRHGSIWEVLPTFELLLAHLEAAKVQYAQHPEQHFKENINLAWVKLNEYYLLTDRSPAYIAATVLHPAHKWMFAEKYWAPAHPEWIQPAKDAVNNLWQRYKAIDIQVPAEIVLQDQPENSALNTDDFFTGSFSADAATNQDHIGEDVYAAWLAHGANPDDIRVSDPIEYWILKLQGTQYPRLAHMALNLMSAPAMSTSNKQDFNQTGLVWKSTRSTLDADVLGVTISMASWDVEQLICITDGKLQHGTQRKRHHKEISDQSGLSDNSEGEGEDDSE